MRIRHTTTLLLACSLAALSLKIGNAEEVSSFLERGLALMESGNNEQALSVAEEGLKEHPGDFYLRKLQAGAYAAIGDYETARPIYRELMASSPGDVSLAESLSAISSAAEANRNENFRNQIPRSEYGRVNTQFDPDPSLDGEAKARRWDLAVSAIPQYDSNVLNVNDPGSSPLGISSGSIVLSADAEYRIIDQNIDNTDFTWGFQGSAYHNHYFKSAAQDFNYTYLDGSMFLRRDTELFGNSLEWEFDIGYSHGLVGGDGYSDGLDTGLFIGYDLGDFATLGLNYHYYQRNYHDDPAVLGSLFGRDADEHIAGINLSRYFGDRLFALIGYNYREHDAEGSQYTYSSHEYFGMVGYALNERLTVTTRISHEDIDYPEYIGPVLGRSDDYTILSLGAEYKVNDNLSVVGSYSHVISESNDNFFDYDKNLGGLGLRYRF